jgi:hypothetical protein
VTRADGEERRRLELIGWMTVGLLAALSVPLVWLAPVWLQKFGLDQRLLEQGEGYTRAMALTLAPMLGVARATPATTSAASASAAATTTERGHGSAGMRHPSTGAERGPASPGPHGAVRSDHGLRVSDGRGH